MNPTPNEPNAPSQSRASIQDRQVMDAVGFPNALTNQED